jgi:hypothetical protein
LDEAAKYWTQQNLEIHKESQPLTTRSLVPFTRKALFVYFPELLTATPVMQAASHPRNILWQLAKAMMDVKPNVKTDIP